MDRGWMNALRTTKEYEIGVDSFIEFAKRNLPEEDGKFFCPCVKCMNSRRLGVDDLKDHLICYGISLQYKTWIWHGEEESSCGSQSREYMNDVDQARIEKMIHDVEAESFTQSKAYDSIRSDAETPLYPGSSFTRLSGTLELLNIKATCGWTDSSFTMLLELLCRMLPDENTLPNRLYEAKKIMSAMGMEYKKIHSCPNDCVLYRNEYEDLSKCPKCQTPRYKMTKGGDTIGEKKKRQPVKVMWYLPIIP